MTEIRLFLSGIPAPGGSKNAFPVYSKGKLILKDGRPIIRLVDAGGKANAAWKKAVSLQAFTQFKEAPWNCPISVEFHFVMPRPKYHFGTGKNAERLKDDAPTFHDVKPDLTKLIRSTEDALTGRLWTDDAQIWFQSGSKVYGANTGVFIKMRALEPSPLDQHYQDMHLADLMEDVTPASSAGTVGT